MEEVAVESKEEELKSLKAAAYDIISALEQARNQLNAINQRITELNQDRGGGS